MELLFSVLGLIYIFYLFYTKYYPQYINTKKQKILDSPLQIKVVKDIFTFENSTKKNIIKINIRGKLIPDDYPAQQLTLGYCISIFDVTDEYPAPVISLLDDSKEQETDTYYYENKIGNVKKYNGYDKWIVANSILPEILKTKKSGPRDLEIVLRLVNWKNKPIFYKFGKFLSCKRNS